MTYLGLKLRISGAYTYIRYMPHGVDKEIFKIYPIISENSEKKLIKLN